MEKIRIYMREAYDELMHKVTWPSWAELQQSALVVLVAALIMALVVVAMDLASKYGIQEGLYKMIIPN
jgi:preprotein translocase subunit SecE